ncbi:MAG TPA: type II toxin-antitoxin system VapC family toxin [Gaiellaceae bacterium]|nr:type II toxin-antitoxin system VapC family toxin [Gaiellaceae bacterium]
MVRLEPRASWVDSQLEQADVVRAPHLIDAEVIGVIRRYVLQGQVDAHTGERALADYEKLRMTRLPHMPLLRRVWELRDNVSAADGFYVALAEVLGAPLVTTNASLARVPRLEIEIRAFA